MSASRAKKKQRRRARRPAAQAPSPTVAGRFEARDGVSRPDAIWAPFPLTEIALAVGLAIAAVGFLGDRLRLMAIGGGVLAVAVSELSLREHFAGFRSHAVLLAVLPVAVLHTLVTFAIARGWRGPLTVGVDVLLVAGLARFLRERFTLAQERAAAPPT